MNGTGIEMTEPRYISYNIDVPNPLLKVVFNTVPKFSADEKATQYYCSYLGQGKNSILYNELLKKGYAVYVNAQHKTYRYYGEFSIDIIGNPDTSLAVICKKLDKLLNDIVLTRNIYPGTTNKQIPGTFQPPMVLPPNMPIHPNMPPQPVVNNLPSPQQ